MAATEEQVTVSALIPTVVEIDPLDEFFAAIRNPQTKRGYEKDLKRFFDFLQLEGSMKIQAKEFAKRAKDPAWATYQINRYIQFQKERVQKHEIEDSRVANLYKPIRLFCEEIEPPIALNWKKLARRVPKGRRAANDMPPSLQDIRSTLSYSDRRTKPAGLIMVSSGCRIGAFEYLNWGHIEPIKKSEIVAAKIRIYAGTNEEYFAFITPEAYRAVEEYLNYRESEGEKIKDDSPVMRDLIRGDRWGKANPAQVTRLKANGVKRLIEDALKTQRVRGKLPEGKRRHVFQANHGFRKFFKSICERKMKSLHVEILMGHSVGLADNYYRPQEEELLEEYLKAVPELTIFEERPPEVTGEEIESIREQLARSEKANQELKNYMLHHLERLESLYEEGKSGVYAGSFEEPEATDAKMSNFGDFEKALDEAKRRTRPGKDKKE